MTRAVLLTSRTILAYLTAPAQHCPHQSKGECDECWWGRVW